MYCTYRKQRPIHNVLLSTIMLLTIHENEKTHESAGTTISQNPESDAISQEIASPLTRDATFSKADRSVFVSRESYLLPAINVQNTRIFMDSRTHDLAVSHSVISGMNE